MKSLQKFTMSAIGLLAGTFVASGVAIDPSNYNYMMTIAPASGMVSGTLSNFPILVRLSAARHRNFNPADCGENGANLRFALEDGTVLAHEIDTWNADGESLVWVNVPSLKGSTLIAAYWGVKDAAAAPTVNPADTWPDFVAVYHLGEGGTTANDSSGNNYTAVLSDGSASSGSSPKVGGCANVSGYFQTSETALATGVKPLTDWSKLTISAWISVDAWNAGGNDKENISLANKMSGWNKETGGFHCRYFANSPSVQPSKPLFTLVRNSGPNFNPALDNWSTGLDSASAGNWRYLTCTVDGSSGTHYVNGVSKGTHTFTGGIAAPNQTPLQFGVAKVDGFAARMDELRIRNGAASAAWIAADYAQQNSSSFLDYGLVCGASAILPLPSGGAFLDYLAAKSNRTQESPFATGGDIILMISSSEYVHIFTNVASASTLELSQSVTARILCVGGGGPGGCNNSAHPVPGGGGGAGGFVERKDVKLAAGTYSIVVGRGGVPSAANTPNNSGGDSAVITSGEIDIMRAHGGGGGGSPSSYGTLVSADDPRCGRNGASGGGSCAWNYGDTTGIGGKALYGAEGNRGGHAKGQEQGGNNKTAAGGGGAGQEGYDAYDTEYPRKGGNGKPCDITGEEIWYAGGGAGGFWYESSSDNNSAGGRGGGGSVAININATGNKIEATDAVRGTGGGGYGGTLYNQTTTSVGNGADGIVIVRVVKPSGGLVIFAL